jgi:hypothetical protein
MGHCVTGAAAAVAIFRFHADKIARHTHTQHYARITQWVEATNNAFIIIIFEWSVCLIVIYPLLCRRPKYIYETNTPGYNMYSVFFHVPALGLMCAHTHKPWGLLYKYNISQSRAAVYLLLFCNNIILLWTAGPMLLMRGVAWRAFRLWTERVVIRHLSSLSLLDAWRLPKVLLVLVRRAHCQRLLRGTAKWYDSH